jgi:hypothetical protein
MNRFALSLLLSLALASPALAQVAEPGEPRMAALRAELAPGKQIFIARQMELNPAEEAAFWPVYDDFQEEMAALAERRRNIVAAQVRIAASGPAQDDDLQDITEEMLAIQAEEARLFERTFGRLGRAIPEAKALRYLQLETKLLALARYDAAAALP